LPRGPATRVPYFLLPQAHCSSRLHPGMTIHPDQAAAATRCRRTRSRGGAAARGAAEGRSLRRSAAGLPGAERRRGGRLGRRRRRERGGWRSFATWPRVCPCCCWRRRSSPRRPRRPCRLEFAEERVGGRVRGLQDPLQQVRRDCRHGSGQSPPQALDVNHIESDAQPGKFSYATAFSQNVPLVSNIGKQGPGTPTVGLLQFYAMTQHLPSSYNYAYNLSVERELSKTFSAEADYIGSVGRKLGVYVDTNEPTVTANNPSVRGPLAPNEQVFPYNQYGQIYTGEGIGKSSYNGVVAVAKYRGQQGIAVQSSYTLSHSLDNTSAYFGSTTDSLPANPRDLSSEY